MRKTEMKIETLIRSSGWSKFFSLVLFTWKMYFFLPMKKIRKREGSDNLTPANCMKNASVKEMTWVCPRKGKLMSTFLIKKNNRQVVTTNNAFSSRSGNDLIFYERKANFYMLWDFKSDFFIVYCFFIMFQINKARAFYNL